MTPEQSETIRIDFVEELTNLASSLGYNIARVEKLTTIPSDLVRRGSFCVTLVDGRIFKARIFPSAKRARIVHDLSTFTLPGIFPKVYACKGNALWMEWLEGSRCNNHNPSNEICYAAGKIQKQLHKQELPAKYGSLVLSGSEYWQNRLERRIRSLSENGLLSGRELDILGSVTISNRTDTIPLGLTHGDYCPENFIIKPDSSLAIVDIEALAVSSLEYDLARTFHRWQMTDIQRQNYFAGYDSPNVVDLFNRYLHYWQILVLSEAVYFCTVVHPKSAMKPLSKLRQVLGSC